MANPEGGKKPRGYSEEEKQAIRIIAGVLSIGGKAAAGCEESINELSKIAKSGLTGSSLAINLLERISQNSK